MEVLLSPVLVFGPPAAQLLQCIGMLQQLLASAGFVVLAGLCVGCITAAQEAGRARQRRYGLQHRLQSVPRGA